MRIGIVVIRYIRISIKYNSIPSKHYAGYSQKRRRLKQIGTI
jgi:hypothetical protein